MNKLHINKQLAIENRFIPIVNNFVSYVSKSNSLNNKLTRLFHLTIKFIIDNPNIMFT